MLFIKLFCIVVSFFLFLSASFADEKKLSLNLQNAEIQEVLRMLSKPQHKNIIISPMIRGHTALHVEQMSYEEAFNTVLTMHDLYLWKVNDTLFVGLRNEFIQQKQLEKKLQLLDDETRLLITRIWQIRYAKADVIAQLLENSKNTWLSTRGVITVDVRTNILCVRDIEANMKGISLFIAKLDVPVRQVLIEAKLASIDSDYERELGIHYSATRENKSDVVDLAHQREENGRFSLAVLNLPDGSRLNMQLAALERSGHGELISSPSLFTASQQMAVIESGEEIPYQESSSSGATSVTFKKAVLSLKVTPQIMPDNEVLLQLQVNQDKPSKRMVLGVPAINTRHITTHIQVKSGQTIVLGGIYELNEEQSEQAIPFLSKIPLLGWLFKQQNKSKNKRELVIFVTPKVVN